MTVSDHRAIGFGIQWQRYDADAPYPDLVKTVAHVAFEVDDLERALKGERVIIAPNSLGRVWSWPSSRWSAHPWS